MHAVGGPETRQGEEPQDRQRTAPQAGSPQEPADEPKEKAERLREAFARRRISLASMDAPLRLATAGAAASLIGAALTIALRDLVGSPVVLPATAGVTTTLAGPLFTASLALIAVGAGYVMTGVILAHRIVAVIGGLLVTTAIGVETGVLGIGGYAAVLPAWAHLASGLLLTAIWLIAVGVLVWRRDRHGDAEQDRHLRMALLLSYCTLFGAYLLVLRSASPDLNGLTTFPASVSLLMVGLSILATPILQVAATDFGEWGQLAGERVFQATGVRLRLGRLTVPALSCVVLIVLAWTTQPGTVTDRAAGLAKGVLILAAAALLVLLAGRALRLDRQSWPESLSFAGIFTVVAVGVWVVAPVSGWFAGALTVTPTPPVSATGHYTAAATVRSVTLPGGATMLVPLGWLSKTAGSAVIYYDHDPALGMLTLAAERGNPRGATITSIVTSQGLGLPLGPVGRDGPMQRLALTPKTPTTAAVAWFERIRGTAQAYLFYGTLAARDRAAATAQLEAMVHSVRLPGAAPARLPTEAAVLTPAAAQQASTDRMRAGTDGVLVALCALAVVAVAGPGRRWPGRVRAALMLLAISAVMTVLYSADSIGRVLAGPHTAWPFLGETGLLAGIGVLGLAALVLTHHRDEPWARRLPRNLAGLAGGVLAVRLIDSLYGQALSASRVAVWAAILVLLAIAWDVTMSGESMTNHASRYLPRASRVLLLLGYVILLAGTVVFYSGQRVAASGRAVADVFFEPEAVTQAALFRLAVPLLLLLFLMHTFGEEEEAEESRPDGHHRLPGNPAPRP